MLFLIFVDYTKFTMEAKVFGGLDDPSTTSIWSESGQSQSSEPVGDASSAGNDQPSSLVEKSPISLLQELCMKRGLTPHYELIDSEGPVHQRVFTYNVTAGSFTATGKGNAVVFCCR